MPAYSSSDANAFVEAGIFFLVMLMFFVEANVFVDCNRHQIKFILSYREKYADIYVNTIAFVLRDTPTYSDADLYTY